MHSIVDVPFVLLLLSNILLVTLIGYLITHKVKKYMYKIFVFLLINCFIICFGVLIQTLSFDCFGIDPYKFEYFIYIGTVYNPVFVYLLGKSYSRQINKFEKKDCLLFLIPTISLLVLYTNNIHHLFFKVYSMDMAQGEMGPYMLFHSIYSYALIAIGVFNLTSATIRNSGFFSSQSMLLIIGIIVPILINFLGTIKVISLSVMVLPILFTFSALCFGLSIMKYNILSITPIALQIIVNKISDSYLVLGNDDQIIDYNSTFSKTFKLHDKESSRGMYFKDFLYSTGIYLNYNNLIKIIKEVRVDNKTRSSEVFIKNFKKYFSIEITNIINKSNSIGILILFKDITQHKKDIETIKDNQSVLMEKERLATLGAMIGGVAHNLKTPIMSIAGATEGLEDLVNEYKNSVGDPEVTVEDHHAIAGDMMDWVKKIRSYDGYMSDIITAVKGQAVNMNDNQDESFTVDELLSRVNILMKHELKEGQVALNEQVSIDNSVKFDGNVNSLVQVVNNLISNAIQSYPPVDPSEALSATGSSFIKGNGADNGSGAAIGQKITNIQTSRTIDLIISSKNDNIQISVVDHGSGMTDEVKNKLFKEMITTKGHNGSGLGLFMSYSTVKGNFHGDMNFTSELGKGTTFNIILPRK